MKYRFLSVLLIDILIVKTTLMKAKTKEAIIKATMKTKIKLGVNTK